MSHFLRMIQKSDLGQADIEPAGKQLPQQGPKLKKKKIMPPAPVDPNDQKPGPNEFGDHALGN